MIYTNMVVISRIIRSNKIEKGICNNLYFHK